MRIGSRNVPAVPLVLVVLLAAFAVAQREEVGRGAQTLRNVRPAWLLLAIALQGVTYLAVGAVYALLSGALRMRLGFGFAVRLAVVNLFVNSAVPSAGLSGNLFLVQAMSRQGIPVGTGALIVLVERAAYLAMLVVFAAAVLGRAALGGDLAGMPIVGPALALSGVAAIVALAVRRALRTPVAIAEGFVRLLSKAPQWMARGVDTRALLLDAQRLREAGGTSVLSWRVLAAVCLAELALLWADGLTLWALFHGLGSRASMLLASTGYTMATILAQIVVVPGTLELGLGGLFTGFGVRPATAVAVTLAFHALSLWAPLPFGWWFHRVVRGRPADSTAR